MIRAITSPFQLSELLKTEKVKVADEVHALEESHAPA